MAPDLPQGLFFRDTRFLSLMRLRVNGAYPEPLAATTPDPFSGSFVLRDHPKAGRADSNLLVFRHRYVGRGMREDIVVHNFSDEPAFCAIEILLDCDFADLFEVKEGRVEKLGDLSVQSSASRITFKYRRGAFKRASHVDFSVDPRIDEASASYEIIVPARGDWTTCIQLTPVIDEQEITPRYLCGESVERTTPVERLVEWRRRLPVVTSDHDQFRLLLERSTEDLAALRIFDPDYPDRAVVAAGAPWFMTLFGRDSLLTSWMTMIVDPDLALGTLETLARFQGKEVNPLTEEEPGRILHEMRFGETASLSLGGGRVYYGSVDATPLFVMLVGELSRWGNRRGEVDALLPAADRALDWITQYGDRDGDGYVEYQRTNDRGLENQGWKDSWDSTRFKNGKLAEPPVALCEVQGYVYAALVARSHSATEAGDRVLAASLRTRAETLKQNFNRDFWIDDGEYFAMGLDRDKRPLDAVTSNMGHCLWTGIVDEEKAPAVDAPPAREGDVLGMGHPDAGEGHGRLQPDQLPLRERLAARQRDLCRGAHAVRLRRGGAPGDAGNGRRVGLLRRPAAGAVRGALARVVRVPGELPDVVLPAGVGRRVAAALPAHDAAVRARHPQLASAPRARGARLDRPPAPRTDPDHGRLPHHRDAARRALGARRASGAVDRRRAPSRDLSDVSLMLPDVRHRFPGLGDDWVRLDGPAGTLPVDTAIEAMHAYLCSAAPANVGGRFDASIRTTALVDDVRGAVGALLGAVGFAGDLRCERDRVDVRLHARAGAHVDGRRAHRVHPARARLEHHAVGARRPRRRGRGHDASRSTRATGRSISPMSNARWRADGWRGSRSRARRTSPGSRPICAPRRRWRTPRARACTSTQSRGPRTCRSTSTVGASTRS